MPARDVDHARPAAEAAQEAAPEPVQASKTSFSHDGEIPAVAVPAAGAAAPTASELAFDRVPSSDLSHLDRGVHHWESYRADCVAAGKPEKFQDHWRAGHTAAAQWEQPYDHRAINDWKLKPGHSASQAVQDWLKGPTIADYRAAGVADELDELRDELGDGTFDRLFGSANQHEDAAVPGAQRLRISAAAYSIPLIEQMKAIAREHDQKPQPPAVPPVAVVETRVAEKSADKQEQDPVVVAQELGLAQQDRGLV